MLDYPLLKYTGSMVAGAAIYLARFICEEVEPWSPALDDTSKLNIWTLNACVRDLQRVLEVEAKRIHDQRCATQKVSRSEAVSYVTKVYTDTEHHAVSALACADRAALEASFL